MSSTFQSQLPASLLRGTQTTRLLNKPPGNVQDARAARRRGCHYPAQGSGSMVAEWSSGRWPEAALVKEGSKCVLGRGGEVCGRLVSLRQKVQGRWVWGAGQLGVTEERALQWQAIKAGTRIGWEVFPRLQVLPHPGGHSFHTALIPKLQKMRLQGMRAGLSVRGFAGTCVEDNIKDGRADSSLMVGTQRFHWQGIGFHSWSGN